MNFQFGVHIRSEYQEADQDRAIIKIIKHRRGPPIVLI